jgi:hypothetical protein
MSVSRNLYLQIFDRELADIEQVQPFVHARMSIDTKLSKQSPMSKMSQILTFTFFCGKKVDQDFNAEINYWYH